MTAQTFTVGQMIDYRDSRGNSKPALLVSMGTTDLFDVAVEEGNLPPLADAQTNIPDGTAIVLIRSFVKEQSVYMRHVALYTREDLPNDYLLTTGRPHSVGLPIGEDSFVYVEPPAAEVTDMFMYDGSEDSEDVEDGLKDY